MSSAICINLDQSKIKSSGNGFISTKLCISSTQLVNLISSFEREVNSITTGDVM